MLSLSLCCCKHVLRPSCKRQRQLSIQASHYSPDVKAADVFQLFVVAAAAAAALIGQSRCCSTPKEAAQFWQAAAVCAGLNQPDLSTWDSSKWVFRSSGFKYSPTHPQHV
jgi:hypothetical protein